MHHVIRILRLFRQDVLRFINSTYITTVLRHNCVYSVCLLKIVIMYRSVYLFPETEVRPFRTLFAE